MTTPSDSLLASTVARHFKGATIEANTAVLGPDGITVGCRVGTTKPAFGVQSAQLLFTISSKLLQGPVEVSTTHYGQTIEEAVIAGGRAWADSFVPLLAAGLQRQQIEEPDDTFVLAHRGSVMHVYVRMLDKVLHFSASGCEDTAAARARFGLRPSMAFHVLGSGPEKLATDRTQLLSVFAGEIQQKRVFEAKLDGVVLAGFDGLLGGVPPAPAPEYVALRELAVIVPA